MFCKKIRSTGVYLSMIILGLLALTMVLSAQPALADRLPQSAYQQLQAAWRRAAQIGQYDYHSTILQTTTPAANLRNAGRGSQTQRVRIDGRLDKAADAMQMQVQVGQQPPIAVKVEEGQAYGRQGSGGEWVALEQTPDFFAPGGDPLGFLVATENVRELDPSETGMEDVYAPVELLATRDSDHEGVSRYAFELSGPKFAQFMRAQMEAELRRNGELPPSLSLSTASQYVEMTGHGEMWLGANGLPMRLLIHVDFPEQASTNGQVSADISTAFSGWAGLPNRAWPQLWHDPTLLLTQPSAVTGISPQLAQEMGMTLAAALLVLGLLALLLTHRRLWAVRAAVYGLIIVSMVVTPLLQSQQVSAFYDGQQARALEEVAANQEPTTENAYNPHENPLRLAMATSSGQPSVREAVQATTVSRAVMAQVASDCTVTESSDCDKDGLIDQIEIHQLGTFVNDVDTDGDLISDKSEIQPFTVGGQSWYLDPRSPDSNGDGLADSTECSDRVDVRLTDYTAPSTYAACPDTDGDGMPDVYDFDNDGDGVPDSADSAPDEFQPIADGKFGFALKGYEANRSLFVDLVMRPTDDRHLWWANNVLDWPANDVRGQVQRVTDDEMPGGGDMRLTPLLEVAIPYSAANPTRGLPVLDGVEPSSVGKTTPLDEWVDQERLASYGIVHSGPRTQDGLIYLYAPMAILEDKTGQTPVAFGATLLYEMAGNASGWGSDHEMRLIWTVNGLVDSCDVDAALENGLPADEADTYCNDYANWTSQSSPLQAYYDDFVLTSLTVQEDHGASALIVAQNANGAAYESDLWHLADTLHDTYLEGETVNNQRLTLSQIPSHFNGWGIGNGALSVQVFSDLHDQTALAEALTGAEILTALSTSHPNAGEDDAANLLFVVEQTAVSASLGAAGTTVSAGTITLDLSGMDAETTGAVRWNPYLYANGGWTQQNVASYVSQLTTALASVLTKDALVNAGLASAADDAELVSDGAAVLATNYYLTLYAGGTALVASGDSNLDSEALVDGDHVKPAEPVMTIVARLTAAVQNRFAQLSLSNLTIESSDSALENVANATWTNLASSPSAILTAMGQVAAGDTSSSALLALEEMVAPPAPQSISGSGMLDAMALVFTAYTLKFEAGSPGANTIPGDVRSGLYVVRLGLVLNQLHEAYGMARTIQDIKSRTVELLLESYERDSAEFAAAYNSALQSFARAENASRWVANKPSVYMARLGLVFDLALIGYTFTNTVISQHVALDSPAFNQLAAQAVAQVIVAASSYALTVLAAASPGLNILLVLVLLVDAVISIVCAAENRHDWWCGGINGLITKGITYAINDVTLLMDLERENQFTVDFDTPTLKAVDQVEGFAVGNTLALSATITANAYTGHPTWMGYLYSWQLRDENVKETAVDFRLQGNQTDFENTLRFGGTDWRFVGAETILDSSGNPAELPQPGKRFEAEFQTSTDAKLERAGVNVGLSSAYLSEAVRVKKQDCWLTFIPPVGFFPFCGTDEVFDSTFHQSLEDTFVFDVFPATLDEFHTLVQDTAGEPGMRLAWDEAFPLLRDADGDGLVSKAFNGPDPDDGNPDTDADGLSDFYEYQNGFNATEADGDCDGLTDYWEAFYNTDPKNRDSDHDGLTDGREVLHPNVRYPYEKSVFSNATAPSCAGENGLTGNYAGGWSTVYAFNGDAPLHYWVSADPNDADSDDDGLTDRSEQVYGYNPHAPSELDVLALETQISTSRGVGAYLGTGDTIDYAATVTNDLSDRYLRGLLESELPVDHVIKTQEIDLLTPLAAATLSGNIAVADAGISASSATSMTLRAGVNVDDAVDNGQSLWLHMNEAPGATTFADASLNGNDVSCTACPTATGSALRFSSVEQQITSGPHLFDFNAFSVGMWVKQVSDSGGFIPLTVINTQTNSSVAYITWDTAAGGDSTRVNGGVWHNNSSTDVATTFTNWPGTWKHLMLTYDRAARTLNFYLNGVSIGSKTNAVQIDTNPAALQVTISGIVDSPGTHVFEMDEFEFYPRVLDANTILERYGKAPLQFDLTQTGNGVSCSGSRCPTMNSDGATFDQTKHLALDTSSLSFSNNQFSIAVNVKPQLRPHPFNEGAGSHFGIDTSQDWQGVYGYQDPSNTKLIFPSLYVGSQGALRIDMGDGTNTCSYQTADDIVAFDVEQQVAISYDGSAFTVYVNGEEQASGAPTACSGVQIPDVNQLYAGRPNNAGYFYWDRVTYDYLNDVLGDAELCLTFDVNSTAAALWHDYNVPYVTNSIPRTDQLDVGKRIADDATHWFRFHEDDAANDSCNYSSSSGAYTDDELVHKDNLSNASGLGGTFSSGFQDRDNDPDKGTLYWSLSNEFFVGTLRNLRVFDYALSPTGAERVYNTETFALQMDFDEAPGETTMTDSSGNYFVAGCAGASCPDSGIPGRWNGALRFDGGVADDDGNDGTVDYLSMNTTDAALGFDSGSFTIMAWVKPDSVSAHWQRIIGASKANSINGVGFGLREGQIAFTTFGIKDYVSSASTPTGVWTHVAVSFDSNHNATFFVNGETVGTVSGNAAAALNADDVYTIGALIAENGSVTEPFDGLIDDLRILRFAANAGAVQAIMNQAPLLNLHLDEDIDITTFVNDAPATASGTCAGNTCPGAGDKGAMRESATFDGVDDRIEVADKDVLDLDEFTIALWAKPTQIRTDYQAILTKESSKDDRNYGLFIHPDNMRLTYGMASGCASGVAQNSQGGLLQNQWNHVVMTYDGAQARVYINGSVDASVLNVTAPCHNNQPVQIGDGIHRYSGFAGNLDEITIEQGALSAEQVAALYSYQSAWYDKKQQHTILVDADAPTVAVALHAAFIEPGQVLYIDAADPTVNGVASGLANVQYSIDGGAFVDAAVDTNAYLIPASATQNLNEGSHSVQVRATDNVGLSSTAAAQTVQVDSTPPNPGPGVNMGDEPIQPNRGSFNLYGRATDNEGAVQSGIDISSVQATLRDHNGVLVSGPVAVTPLNGLQWQSTHDLELGAYGQYSFEASARDLAGNEGTGSDTVWIDGVPSYGDMLSASNIITGADAIIGGLASDIPYPESGRKLHFHFEEETGATLFYDGSVNHLNAACSGDSCPTAGSPGQNDSAAAFGGADYLTISDQEGITAAQVLDLHGNFTLMAWVKPGTLSGSQWILAAQQTNSAGGIAFGLSGDKLLLRAFGVEDYLSTTGITADAWSHVAAAYNATDNSITFYVNGEELEAVAGSTDLVVNSDDAYRIGEGFTGAIDELVVYGVNLSEETIYDVVNPVPVNTSQIKVRYRHASGVVWPHLDPDGLALYLPLDEALGSDSFEDLSVYGRDAACGATDSTSSPTDASISSCPLAAQNDGLQSIETGAHLEFDGTDDFLSVPNVLDPAATDFTTALWFNVSPLSSGDRYLLQQVDSGGVGRAWLFVTDSGALRSFLGGSTLEHPTQVTPNTWHHAALTYHLATQTLTLYLDGVPASTTRALEGSDGAMLVGTNKSFTHNFRGNIDEVVVFDRALSATEIGHLGQSPWHDASPVYDSLDNGDTLGVDDRLRPWSHDVPTGLEGPYKIDLLVADGPVPAQREGVSHGVWTGEIDTTAPRVAMTYTLSADKQTVTISCAAADFNLSEEGWECPVDDANRSHHLKDAAWFTTIFSGTEKLAGFTTASEIFTPTADLHVTACDLWGQCSMLGPQDTDGDGIPDHVEGDGDRDGDGILDAHDYDPDGHFYELGTGRIIPGGRVSISGPGPVQIDPDGSTGYYDWTTEGVPGLYSMSVTPPPGYIVSPDCPPQAGAIAPNGTEPQILGSSEVSETETLANGSCAGNPYYLQFNVMNGEPFVFNNNIPLQKMEGALTEQLFMPILANNGLFSGVTDPTSDSGQEEPPSTLPALEHPLFLPIIGKDAQVAAADVPPASQPDANRPPDDVTVRSAVASSDAAGVDTGAENPGTTEVDTTRPSPILLPLIVSK